MGRREEGSASASAALRKGPWMAEEDEVLVEYVRKHGPRDWSSIRHRGLLPRSGKSCRLRWVNKLKPDLKTGCKFSAEEERIVIDLQAQFGNRWARIATYLPGRTDNDVKNFWSTRQKRLARLLQAQSSSKPPAADATTSRGKSAAAAALLQQQPSSSDRDVKDDARSQLPGGGLIRSSEEPCSQRKLQFAAGNNPGHPQFSFLQLPQSLLDLPVLPENHHLAMEFDRFYFEQDPLDGNQPGVPEFDLQLADGLPCLGLDPIGDVKMEDNDEVPSAAEGFFGDFPVDILDSLNPPPSSSSGSQQMSK